MPLTFTHGKSQMSIESHSINTVIINVLIVIVELEVFEMAFNVQKLGWEVYISMITYLDYISENI